MSYSILLEGDPGADWLKRISCVICASFGCRVTVAVGCAICSISATDTPTMASGGTGLPSLDRLSGVMVPLIPIWLGDAGADLKQQKNVSPLSCWIYFSEYNIFTFFYQNCNGLGSESSSSLKRTCLVCRVHTMASGALVMSESDQLPWYWATV